MGLGAPGGGGRRGGGGEEGGDSRVGVGGAWVEQ